MEQYASPSVKTPPARKGQSEGKKKGIPGIIDKTVSSTYEDLMAIMDAKLELIRIEAMEKIAMVGAVAFLAIVLLIGTAYLITSLALFIGEILGYYFLGYLIVALVFLGTFFFFARFRPDLLRNFIYKTLLSANDKR